MIRFVCSQRENWLSQVMQLCTNVICSNACHWQMACFLTRWQELHLINLDLRPSLDTACFCFHSKLSLLMSMIVFKMEWLVFIFFLLTARLSLYICNVLLLRNCCVFYNFCLVGALSSILFYGARTSRMLHTIFHRSAVNELHMLMHALLETLCWSLIMSKIHPWCVSRYACLTHAV